MNVFTTATIESIGSYVYCLLDPRDNNIFYIGKGKGNRIFDHVNDYENMQTDETKKNSDKIDRIKEIKKNNQEVKHFILKHELSDSTAIQLESCLIDLFTHSEFNFNHDLTNLISGHGSWDKGIKTVEEIEILYSATQLDKKDINHNILIININNSYKRENDVYEATRKSWKINLEKAKKVDYVLAEYRGIVRQVFKPTTWSQNSKRVEFEGEVANEDILKLFLHKKTWSKPKGQSNPIQYLFQKFNES